MRGCGIFVATRSQQTRLVGCGGRLFLVIPLGFKPKTFRTFSDLIRLNEKRESPFWELPFPRDPVGIQTQDLQNRNLTLYSAKLRDQMAPAARVMLVLRVQRYKEKLKLQS